MTLLWTTRGLFMNIPSVFGRNRGERPSSSTQRLMLVPPRQILLHHLNRNSPLKPNHRANPLRPHKPRRSASSRYAASSMARSYATRSQFSHLLSVCCTSQEVGNTSLVAHDLDFTSRSYRHQHSAIMYARLSSPGPSNLYTHHKNGNTFHE